jgi:hypothetical protein
MKAASIFFLPRFTGRPILRLLVDVCLLGLGPHRGEDARAYIGRDLRDTDRRG